MKLDYYKILEVEPTSSADEIRRAYRRLAMAWHPDQNKSPGAEERFKEINEAYHVLIDEQSRKAYDQARSTGREWQTHYTKQDAERQFTEEMAAMGLQLAVMGVPLDDLVACLVYFGTPYAFAVKIGTQLKIVGQEQINKIAGDFAGESVKRILIGLVSGIFSPVYGIANVGIGVYCFAKSLFIRKKGLSLDLPATENVRHGVANYHESQCPSCQQWHRTSPVFGGDRHVCPLCFSIYTISVEVPITRVTVCTRCHSPIVYAKAPTPVIRCEKCELKTSADKHDAPVEKPVLICPHCSDPLARQDSDPKERHLYRCNKCHGVFVIAKHVPAKPCCPACKQELPKDISLSQDETPCQHCGAHLAVQNGYLTLVSILVPCPACQSNLRVKAQSRGTPGFLHCPTCNVLLSKHGGDITLPTCPHCSNAQMVKQTTTDDPVRCNHCDADYNIGRATLDLVSFCDTCPSCKQRLRLSGSMLNTHTFIECLMCNGVLQVALNSLSLPNCPQCNSPSAFIPRDNESGELHCIKCGAFVKIHADKFELISVCMTCPSCMGKLRISADFIAREGDQCSCVHCSCLLFARHGTLLEPNCPSCSKPMVLTQQNVDHEAFCKNCGAGVMLANGMLTIITRKMKCPACARPLRVKQSFLAREGNPTSCPDCENILLAGHDQLSCPACTECGAPLLIKAKHDHQETKCILCASFLECSDGIINLVAVTRKCPCCRGSLKISASLINDGGCQTACPSCFSLFFVQGRQLHISSCADCGKIVQLYESRDSSVAKCSSCAAEMEITGATLTLVSRVRSCPHCKSTLRLNETFLRVEHNQSACPVCKHQFCVEHSGASVNLSKA